MFAYLTLWAITQVVIITVKVKPCKWVEQIVHTIMTLYEVLSFKRKQNKVKKKRRTIYPQGNALKVWRVLQCYFRR